MKKIMRFLSMAALVLMGAAMTGCISGELVDEQAENNSKMVTLTTTVGLGTPTKALTAEGVKTFAEGETMAVVYNNGTTMVKTVSRALEAGDLIDGGRSATFTFALETPNTSVDVTYIYPASMAKADGSVNYDALATQDGTLASLSSNLDLATYTGAWEGTSLPSCTLVNQLAILAITLKDFEGSEITGGISGMTVSDGTNDYAVSRAAAAGPIYVAILPTASAKIWISATTGTVNYIKSLTEKTYEASKGYNVSWKMATFGDVILSDGTLAKAGTAGAAAMIAYAGTVAGVCDHGLAISLTDAYEYNATFAEATGEVIISSWATYHPVTGGIWRLPSETDWQYMLWGYYVSNPAATNISTFQTSLGSAGTALASDAYYWTCTEDGDNAKSVYYDGTYAAIPSLAKTVYEHVRACLAF